MKHAIIVSLCRFVAFFGLAVLFFPGNLSAQDADGDGLSDQLEGKVDTDEDGILDYLDTDSDGDGVPDSVEGENDSDVDGIRDSIDFQPPFDCSEGVAYQSYNSLTQLAKVNLTTGNFIHVGGVEHGMNYNAIAYNPEDDYIYGMDKTSSAARMVRLGSDGSIVRLGEIEGLPASYVAGSFGGEKGIYYTSGGGRIFGVDVVERKVVSAFALDPAPTRTAIDLAYSVVTGKMYGSGGAGVFFEVDPSSGKTVDIGNTGKTFGALVADSTGTVYGFDNGGTGAFRVNLSNAQVTWFASSPQTSTNDGTICPKAMIATDTDGDGVSDASDPDDDNDGILDEDETLDDFDPNGDEDGDGIPNWTDYIDDDGGDSPGTDYEDTNGDGIPDVFDTDGDGTPNHQDTNSDNDGIPDEEETDIDTDGDGVPDFLDTDSDGDGVPDSEEGTGDEDGDGVPDYLDGPTVADALCKEVDRYRISLIKATEQLKSFQAVREKIAAEGIRGVMEKLDWELAAADEEARRTGVKIVPGGHVESLNEITEVLYTELLSLTASVGTLQEFCSAIDDFTLLISKDMQIISRKLTVGRPTYKGITYYAIEYENGRIERGKLAPGETINTIMPVKMCYTVHMYNRASRLYGSAVGITGCDGEKVFITAVDLNQDTRPLPDWDEDDLADLAEFVIGCDPDVPDTDDDGIKDGSEVEQGTDPGQQTGTVLGVISGAPSTGPAEGVCVGDGLAITAEGESGFTIFNVADINRPIRVARFDTPGFALAASCGGGVVAVADGTGGCQFASIKDPANPKLMPSVDVGDEVTAVAMNGSVCYAGTVGGELVRIDSG